MKLSRLASIFFLSIICLLCVFFVLRHCTLMERRINRISRLTFTPKQPGSPKPARILHPIAADGYLWIQHAQNMVKEGHWRLNHTTFDNAPKGRDVHWNSGFAWWLIGLGWINKTFSGIPHDRAIAQSAVWANTILLALCLLVLPLLVFRRLGIYAATLLALGMVACREFYEHFIPAYPDHHGLISVTALCSILFLLMAGAGWIRETSEGNCPALFPETEKQARLWAIIAALFSAAALWASAVSQVLLLIGIGLGIIASMVLFVKIIPKKDLRYYPQIWSIWGRFGAGFSLFFYFLEYFPDKMGMQLLVNHPLHAAAWLGGGEALATLTNLLYDSRRPKKNEWYRLGAGVFLIILYPAFMTLGNPAWWSLRDPFMVTLHRTILEFKPLLPRLMNGSVGFWGWIWSNIFYLIPGSILVFIRRIPAVYRAMILFSLVPALLFTFLSFYQTRWSMHCGSVFIILLVVVTYIVLHHLSQSNKKGKVATSVIISTILITLAISPIRTLKTASTLASSKKRMMLSLGEGRDLLAREIGLKIDRLSKDKEVIILSSPNTTLRTCYFGHHRGIGTLYWENLEGLKAAAEIFSTPDDTKAQRLLKERGITHIVFTHAPNAMFSYIDTYFDLHSINNNKLKFKESFAYKLFYRRQIPIWLRQVPYPPNVLTKLLKAEILILEVTDRKNFIEIN